jgi:hypothetical protein
MNELNWVIKSTIFWVVKLYSLEVLEEYTASILRAAK